MATANYMEGRVKYQRPQGMLWADNSGTLQTLGEGTINERDVYVPEGVENQDFIVLTDDNRSPLQFTVQRIERRERTINGRMRSYHIADKLALTVSWEMLPSRASNRPPAFDPSTGKPGPGNPGLEYLSHTSDNAAAGAEILDWYRNHIGPFWVYLAYDNYKIFGDDVLAYAHLNQYSQVMEMYIASFDYSIEKRGGTGKDSYDFWNISLTLEEA
jgi:hypothetical protein